MRVISGNARGLRLKSPDGIETRPTLDRVKEAVFSMLLPCLNGAAVLDLFAGSGALGIEALSRGADKSYFVDLSREAIQCIKANVVSAKFVECSEIIAEDAFSFLRKCDEKFDIIFLDPPYAGDMYTEILDLIAKKKTLSQNGLIVVEWDNESAFDKCKCQYFDVLKEKKYGRVGITVLKWS